MTGAETLFWKNRWLNGRAPMLIWPEEFSASHQQNDTVRDMIHMLSEAPFMDLLDCCLIGRGFNLTCGLKRIRSGGRYLQRGFSP